MHQKPDLEFFEPEPGRMKTDLLQDQNTQPLSSESSEFGKYDACVYSFKDSWFLRTQAWNDLERQKQSVAHFEAVKAFAEHLDWEVSVATKTLKNIHLKLNFMILIMIQSKFFLIQFL